MIQGINRRLRGLPGNSFNQRWGANTTMTLTNYDGDVYLFRRRLIQTPIFAIYLHDIQQGDDIVDYCHSHPFGFLSLVLRGGYTEKRESTDGGSLLLWTEIRTLSRGRFNLYPRGHGKVHTIIHAEQGTKTLVFAGPRKNSWGWFVPGRGLVHWSEFLVEQGRTADGRRKAG